MNPNRPARLNRAVLAVLGLLALLAGVVVLLAGIGILATLLPMVPIRSDVPLLPGNLSLPGWVPWAGAAAAVVVGLLVLRWLIAQTIRRPSSSDWQLAPDTATGTTHIDSDTAAEPLAPGDRRLPRRAVRDRTAHRATPTPPPLPEGHRR